MTREEAQLKRNVISLEPCFVQDAKMCNLINEIYDEREKSKDKKIIKLKELLKKQKQRMTTIKQATKGMEDTQNQINILLKGME